MAEPPAPRGVIPGNAVRRTDQPVLVDCGQGADESKGHPISVIPLMRGLPGMAAQGSPITAGVMVALGGVGCVITLGSLVFGVWGLVLMFLFRGAFGRAAEEARSTWAGTRASAG